MKIGLIDVDGHNYPNLVLMKLLNLGTRQQKMADGMTQKNQIKT